MPGDYIQENQARWDAAMRYLGIERAFGMSSSVNAEIMMAIVAKLQALEARLSDQPKLDDPD